MCFNTTSGGLEMMDFIDDRGVTSDARAAARPIAPARAHMRGAVPVSRLIVVSAIALVLVAGAAWWYMGRPGSGVLQSAVVANVATPGMPDALTPVAVEEDLSVGDLYRQARAAMSDNRMVNPAGNNALEYYLRILAKQPGDSNATDALRELFPFATGSAEDQINQGNFDEANRIVTLLATADPSNYTLTILRSKLDARKRQGDRELALQAQKEAAAATAAARPQPPGAAPASADVVAASAVSAPASASSQPVAAANSNAVAVATPAPDVVPPPPPVAPVGETREVRMLTPPNPSYPAAAVRNRQNGWVEVQFTVDADGSVKNARVTAAEPRGVFDREALTAVQKAKFEARLEKGAPVSSTLRRRIEFKLN